MYIVHHFILLRLNPFDLSVDREGWWFEHSVSKLRVWLSAEGAKTFPGPSYVSSEDGVVWLWHLLVNLYLFFFHEHFRFTGQQKRGKGISLTPHYHFHPLHRHLDISRTITAEILPLHIASSQTQTRNLIYTYVILICI